MEPLFISGPSGVGKSFLTRQLCARYSCQKIVTTTTRAPRIGERDGVDYYFVSPEVYKSLERTGQLCISDHLFSASYGVQQGEVESIQAAGKTPICEVYAPHIAVFTEAFPNARAIFLMPVSYSLLVERMRKRGDSDKKIVDRLALARVEVEAYHAFADSHFSKSYQVEEGAFEQLMQVINQDFLQG